MFSIPPYVIGGLVSLLAIGISFIYWNWKSKQNVAQDFTIPTDSSEDVEPPLSFNEMLDTRKDKDLLSGKTDLYDWTQNNREVEMYIRVPSTTAARDVKCKIKQNSLEVIVSNVALIKKNFYAEVVPDECNWQMDGEGDQRVLWITLFKLHPTERNQHWKCVLEGDEEIDVKHLGPPVHTLDINDANSIKEAMKKVSHYKK